LDSSTSTVASDYNCYDNVCAVRKWSNMMKGVEPGPNDFMADPYMVEDELPPSGILDFRLMPISPCIDAGDPDPKYDDMDETRNDIGAYGGPCDE
jgi:hypothetical protein